ncbi:hypothetical protein XH81_16465 [Bradyrhizobium sp. CCBAU 25360]|uniref:hypothetical protein n=1 Tax=Bradyrhizobium sp. CCBAU 25360 TaxID=858425 RepID=UPI002304FE23|nr:hypothetical protein [Bradyrhizobium sp. CCBAU 25360]MDA9416431.1 hypothetical protein [Bradyrhizobium sp. CCBAU 25360]
MDEAAYTLQMRDLDSKEQEATQLAVQAVENAIRMKRERILAYINFEMGRQKRSFYKEAQQCQMLSFRSAGKYVRRALATDFWAKWGL